MHVSDEELYSINKTTNQLKTEQRTWKDTAQKIYQWPESTQKGTPPH